MYLLTIAIPTYNRAIYLNNQLKSLIKQVEDFTDIEILICDNCSTDNTKYIVENYIKFNKNVIYFRQEQNIGLDGNVLSCYENANGKYVWYLSDDDIIFDDAIHRVYEFISKHTFSVLAFSFCDNKNKKNCNKAINTYRKYNDFSDSKSIEDFFKVIMISTLVVKKTSIDLDYFKSLEPTIFPQVTLSLMILKKDFCLVAHDMNLLWREAGYITGNFFELYCLKPRFAIKNANYNLDDTNRLLKHTENSLREFIKLSVLERIGYYKSKQGFPISSFKRGFQEYKGSIKNLFLLLIIFLVSRSPRILIMGTVYIAKFLKYKSIKKVQEFRSVLTKHIEKNIQNSRSSDV